MLLLDSLYINNSGGKVLLDYLVSELEKAEIDVFYLFDERCMGDYSWIPNDRKIYLKATLLSRFNFYKDNRAKFSKVFCFGNVPPPIKVNCQVYIYFHNVSLLQQPNNYGLTERLLKKLKMLYIKFVTKNEDVFIVQSNYVAESLRRIIKNNDVLVLPFYEVATEQASSIPKLLDHFVYVSNGNTHKNHSTLLAAWEILAKSGIYPTLHLTVTSNFSYLCSRINELRNQKLQIVNHGYCVPCRLYQQSKFLIYPSLTESFGLGLIEAIHYNCEVLASNLDYVFEVCEPYAVFDPNDAVDIARVVSEALGSVDDSYKTKPKISNKLSSLIEILK